MPGSSTSNSIICKQSNMSDWIWGSTTTTAEAQRLVESLSDTIKSNEEEIARSRQLLHTEKRLRMESMQEDIHMLSSRRERLWAELKSLDLEIEARVASLNLLKQGVQEQETSLEQGDDVEQASSMAAEIPRRKSSASELDAVDMLALEENNGTGKVVVAAEPDTVMEADDEEEEEKKPAAVAVDTTPSPVASAPSSVVAPACKQLDDARAVDPNVMFVLGRSNNSNTVIYSVKKDSAGALVEADSVDVYWIMYEQAGNPREELNMIERNTAYGAAVTADPQGRAAFRKMVLNALPKDTLSVTIDANGRGCCTLTIDNKPGMQMQRVHVESTTSWGLPKVQYIEMFGFDPATGEAVYEKRKP